MSHDRMAAAPPAQTSGQGASAPTAAVAPVSGDVAAGKLVFRKCQACHSLEPDKNGIGPSPCRNHRQKGRWRLRLQLFAAMKATTLRGIATLDGYLADPQKSVPGNKMPFPGLKTENERNAVIAYLAARSSPAAAAAAARSTRRRRRRSERRPRQPNSRRPVTFPDSDTRCAPGSPKGAWSSSASVARSMARSIRYCPRPKVRSCRSP